VLGTAEGFAVGDAVLGTAEGPAVGDAVVVGTADNNIIETASKRRRATLSIITYRCE
jgi:hypothetical protein